MPASGYPLRKIIRRTFTRSIESARAMTGERLPELSMNWEEGTRRFIMTDVGEHGLFRAFDPGTRDRVDLKGWAPGLGQGGSIAFFKSAIEITVPKRGITPIALPPIGGNSGGIYRFYRWIAIGRKPWSERIRDEAIQTLQIIRIRSFLTLLAMRSELW